MTSTRKRGTDAEDVACRFLIKQKLKLVEKNFYCQCGEIDLIMLDHDILVFVEVRHRLKQHFMQAIESIDSKKQRKIILSSQFFLQRNKKMNDHDLRFDVISITNTLDNPEIEWLKNAFQA